MEERSRAHGGRECRGEATIRSWKRQEGSPHPTAESSGRARPCRPDLRPPEPGERDFCCSKPPCLWSCVTAAPGH